MTNVDDGTPKVTTRRRWSEIPGEERGAAIRKLFSDPKVLQDAANLALQLAPLTQWLEGQRAAAGSLSKMMTVDLPKIGPDPEIEGRMQAMLNTRLGGDRPVVHHVIHHHTGTPGPASDRGKEGDGSSPGITQPKRPSDKTVQILVKAIGDLPPDTTLLERVKTVHPGATQEQVRAASRDNFGTRPAHRPKKG